MNRIDRPKALARYDQDFALWSSEQAALLRARHFDAVDFVNVAEEIESLGRSDEDEIENRLNVLVMHLLKWRYQAQNRSPSWRATIIEQRSRILKRLSKSPSLKRYPGEVLSEEYVTARLRAAGETELPEATFPETCPFTIDQVLDKSFYPDPD